MRRLTVCVLTCLASSAWAQSSQDKATADSLLDEGKKLSAAGN
jgi:hypothetical protein